MRNRQLQPVRESVFDVIATMRRRPALYFGAPSLVRLQAYLLGYQAGLGSIGKSLDREAEFHYFHDWVAKKLGYSSSTSGWCNMILEKSASDEEALHRFFALLDEFKLEHGFS